MANLPFDRVVWNPLEKALSTDWNLNTSEQDRSLRDTMLELMKYAETSSPTGYSVSGFVADAFRVIPGGGMDVVVSPGIAFFENASPTTGVGGGGEGVEGGCVLGLDLCQGGLIVRFSRLSGWVEQVIINFLFCVCKRSRKCCLCFACPFHRQSGGE